MNTILTFGNFYDLFIDNHTNMKIRAAINQLFYGDPEGKGMQFVSQSQCSKIRKDGIKPGSQLAKDYLSDRLTVDMRASYLKGLNLYGFDSGKDILQQLDGFYISESLKTELASEKDVHTALAKLLYFLVAIPPRAEDILFAKKEEASPVSTAGPAADPYSFFDEIFRIAPKNLVVDMAFHSGHDYFYREEDVALLQKMLLHGFQIRVLINTQEHLSHMIDHSRQPGKIYHPIEEIYSLWKQKMNATKGQLTVRQTDAPLMHKMYLCHNAEGFALGLVRFYLYGSFSPFNEIGHIYTAESEDYGKLKREFEYLWAHCTDTNQEPAYGEHPREASQEQYNSSESGYDLKQLLEETVARAEAGDPQAMFDAGCMYFHNYNDISGTDVDKDYGQAVRWLDAVSRTDHPAAAKALYMIARLYYYGEIPQEEQSFETAYRLREQLYKINPSPLMALNLLDMKKMGIGTRFNYADIRAFIEKNMELFDDAGLQSAGSFYLTYGEFQKAIDTMDRIDSIVPSAEYELGMLYMHGLHRDPPEPDPKLAMHHLTMAADAGVEKAMYQLGILYFYGTNGFHKNPYKARELFKKAADKGSTASQYLYAWVCRHGLGGNRDLAEAGKYFELGAKSGHFHCMIELAQLCQRKECRDYEKAFFWARKAAESGNPYSEFILGNLYFTGHGCRCDPDKALIHYRKALKYGFFDAEMMIRKIEELRK